MSDRSERKADLLREFDSLNPTARRRKPRKRELFFITISLGLSLEVSGFNAEGILRGLEAVERSKTVHEGTRFKSEPHKRWE